MQLLLRLVVEQNALHLLLDEQPSLYDYVQTLNDHVLFEPPQLLYEHVLPPQLLYEHVLPPQLLYEHILLDEQLLQLLLVAQPSLYDHVLLEKQPPPQLLEHVLLPQLLYEHVLEKQLQQLD
jgi:hypothetical protein